MGPRTIKRLDDATLKELQTSDQEEGCCIQELPARFADNLRTNRQSTKGFYYFDGTKGWAEYDFEKSRGHENFFLFVKLTTDKPRPVNISVDGRSCGTFFKEADTGTFGGEGLKWFSAGMLTCPGGRDTFKLRLDPISFAPHISAVAVMPVETAKQMSEEDAQAVADIKAEMRMIKAEMRKIEERKAKQTSGTVNKLTPGMVVRLKCHHTGKNLALNVDGSQDPTGIRSDGGSGDY